MQCKAKGNLTDRIGPYSIVVVKDGTYDKNFHKVLAETFNWYCALIFCLFILYSA